MSLKLYNTLTKKKEEFKTSDHTVGMYVCGPTVYDVSHVGHGRTYVCFDFFYRYLKFKDYKVNYIINITDVENKIIKRAKDEKRSAQELTEGMTRRFFDDFKNLGNLNPDKMPLVTRHIGDIIAFIKNLIDKGYAYEYQGDVYFSVRKFKDYGKLSKNTPEKLEAGARVEKSDKKKDPLDFALWKNDEGDLTFDSPWGVGRPGWHIECSTLATKYLGETIDIHGGGNDLVFPHHEDEVAQSEAASGKPFARYWIHTGMVTVNGEKMAKSEGNFIIIEDFLKKYPKNTIRYYILKTHYRSPLDFDTDKIAEAKNAIETIKDFVDRLERYQKDGKEKGETAKYKEKFFVALDDDLNTPQALSDLFVLINKLNKTIDEETLSQKEKVDVLSFLKEVLEITGIDLLNEKEEIPKEVVRLAEEREKARKSKDWEKSDSLREEIKKKGYKIEDTDEGFILKKI